MPSTILSARVILQELHPIERTMSGFDEYLLYIDLPEFESMVRMAFTVQHGAPQEMKNRSLKTAFDSAMEKVISNIDIPGFEVD